MAVFSPLITSAWPSRIVPYGIPSAWYLPATKPIGAVSGWPGYWQCGTKVSSSIPSPSQMGSVP